MSLLLILPRFRHFFCVMELVRSKIFDWIFYFKVSFLFKKRGGTIVVALCGIMFGISRFLQLIGAETKTVNDFGVQGEADDVLKVDNFLMVEGIFILIVNILLVFGTCLVSLWCLYRFFCFLIKNLNLTEIRDNDQILRDSKSHQFSCCLYGDSNLDFNDRSYVCVCHGSSRNCRVIFNLVCEFLSFRTYRKYKYWAWVVISHMYA